MRILATFVACAVLFGTAGAQSPLYKVDLDERIDRSELIVEGRVVDQESFWNRSRTLIYAASTIEVYRVFKGQLET